MLLRENFSEAHIKNLQNISRRDPALLERTVYAFGLLEAITQVNTPFIFKERILSENLMTLRYLRKANPEAYAYAVKADSLMLF